MVLNSMTIRALVSTSMPVLAGATTSHTLPKSEVR